MKGHLSRVVLLDIMISVSLVCRHAFSVLVLGTIIVLHGNLYESL